MTRTTRTVNRAALGLPAKRQCTSVVVSSLPVSMAEYDRKEWVIRFDGHPFTVNQLMNCHWATAAKRKRVDRDTIALVGRFIPRATGKRRVSLHLIMAPRQRRPDPDASWKSLLDALVACGLLVEDSPKWCELTPRTEGRGKRAGTVVTLEDV